MVEGHYFHGVIPLLSGNGGQVKEQYLDDNDRIIVHFFVGCF